ncbi:hypothetical protein [Halobacteriovorax sp.]|uniref:hypothetical protein n=1 Tax=Halobacteriovorax sp. TaxID=2020862 RepID=UPI003567E904
MKNRSNLKFLFITLGLFMQMNCFASNSKEINTNIFSDVENSLSRDSFNKAIETLETSGYKVEKLKSKLSTFERTKSKSTTDTLESIEHIVNRLKDEGESSKMEGVFSALKTSDVRNNLSLIEVELNRSKRIIAELTSIGAFERDTFTLKINDLIIDVKEALLLSVNLKNDITTLAGKVSSKGFDATNSNLVKTNSNYLSYFVYFALSGLVIGMFLMMRKLKKKNFELENKDWGSYIRKKAFKSQVETYQTFSDVGAVVIDTNEKILSMNKCFREMFMDDIVNDEKWEDFFLRNFKRERSLKGTFSVYKYMRDVTSDYMIQFSRPDAQGRKSCFIIKFDAGFLTKLGKDREADLEKIKINILDVIDDVIAKESSFKDKNFLDLKDVDYANDLYIYMPELQARTIFEKSLKALLAVQSIKNSSQRAILNVKRKDKNLIFSAILPGIHLDVRDFSKEVSKNVSLNNMMKDIEEIESSYGVTSVWKNTMRDSGRAVSFEMMISDLENVKVEQWEYAL